MCKTSYTLRAVLSSRMSNYSEYPVTIILNINVSCNKKFWKYLTFTLPHSSLTFQSLAVSLRATRFNIQKFYMIPALH
jgi:hypothetical protein